MRILSVANGCECGGNLRMDSRDGITIEACDSCAFSRPVPRQTSAEHPLAAAENAERRALLELYRARYPQCATPDCTEHVTKLGHEFCPECARKRRLERQREKRQGGKRRSA